MNVYFYINALLGFLFAISTLSEASGNTGLYKSLLPPFSWLGFIIAAGLAPIIFKIGVTLFFYFKNKS